MTPDEIVAAYPAITLAAMAYYWDDKDAIDQHVPNAVADGLRLCGVDVTTTAEAGLQGVSDEEHLVYEH